MTAVNTCGSILAMIEKSPYEGTLDTLNGRMCLGKVVTVDGNARTCRVRTIGTAMFGTDDQDLQNVKCQHMVWDPAGSYAVVLPTIGSYVIVAFVNSEPIIVGAYPLSLSDDDGSLTVQQDLLPGDMAFVSSTGSSVIIRSAGTVEIESTKGCRTYWFPIKETITTVCQNWELNPSGGYQNWTTDSVTGNTVLDTKAFDNAVPVNAARMQMGTSDSGALVDLAIGPVDENLDISAPTLTLQIQADGTTNLSVGSGGVTVEITPAGAVTMTTQSDINVTSSGDVNITASGDMNLMASSIALNGTASGITTSNSHMGVIDLITGVPVMPSTTTFGDI